MHAARVKSIESLQSIVCLVDGEMQEVDQTLIFSQLAGTRWKPWGHKDCVETLDAAGLTGGPLSKCSYWPISLCPQDTPLTPSPEGHSLGFLTSAITLKHATTCLRLAS